MTDMIRKGLPVCDLDWTSIRSDPVLGSGLTISLSRFVFTFYCDCHKSIRTIPREERKIVCQGPGQIPPDTNKIVVSMFAMWKLLGA